MAAFIRVTKSGSLKVRQSWREKKKEEERRRGR